jgi:hypothetical protein
LEYVWNTWDSVQAADFPQDRRASIFPPTATVFAALSMRQERRAVVIRDMFGGLGRGLGSLTGNAGGLFEPTLRLGVTGLSRAGKTVFITSLVANLMDRARMHGLRAEAEGRIRGVWLQPQPDDTVPRFDYEAHLAALTGSNPHWPESTRSVSELRLSFKLQTRWIFSAV